MKHSAMSKATIRQRTGVGWIRAESDWGVIKCRSSKHQGPSPKEIPNHKHQSSPDGSKFGYVICVYRVAKARSADL
jgi:hypothetical protein